MNVIKYVDGHATYDAKATATVLTNKKGMPTSYKMNIDGEDTIILKSIGLPVFDDTTGNPHSAGAATMTDENGKSLGWAFMESSGMGSVEQILDNALTAANIPRDKWFLWKERNVFNGVLFMTMCLVAVVSVIVLAVSIVKYKLSKRAKLSYK